MSATDHEKQCGLALAGGLAFVILESGEQTPWAYASLAILILGMLGRLREIHLNAWIEAGLLSLTIGASTVVTLFYRTSGFPPWQAAGIAGAVLLLRRVTPARGLWTVFCGLIILTRLVMPGESRMPDWLVVANAGILMALAVFVHRPPEAVVRPWEAMLRAFRLILPVSVVVVVVFSFFPGLAPQNDPVFTGFSGGDILSPGDVAALHQSHRIAFTAKFPPDSPLPAGSALYWRGNVLEDNEGFRWSRNPRRTDAARLLPEPVDPAPAQWRYRLSGDALIQGNLPLLEQAVTVKASRNGQKVSVLNLASGLFSAGTGRNLVVDASSEPLLPDDPPIPGIAAGNTAVPQALVNDERLKKISDAMPGRGGPLEKNFSWLAKYFRNGRFFYSLNPGMMADTEVGTFLQRRRAGFCEHYAAAGANLLRLAGIPARVVVGYRGGEWNPWRWTITVRDSDAHAWVEAWDQESSRWRRFDPTDYVSPGMRERMNREMDSGRWPWFQRGWRWLRMQGENGIGLLKGALGSMDEWLRILSLALAYLMLAAIAFFLWLFLRKGGPSSKHDAVRRLLTKLEQAARGTDRSRRAGETPLAWLERMQSVAAHPEESRDLHAFAESYDACVYGSHPRSVAKADADSVRRICTNWRKRPASHR